MSDPATRADGGPCLPVVIVVDDEPAVRFLVESLLDREKVVCLPDGRSLGATIRRERPDLVLLDVNLPGPDGFALAADLAAQSAETGAPGFMPGPAPDFMFLTAQDSGEDAARGIGLGAIDYIRKPFSGPEFVARVRGALARRASRASAAAALAGAATAAGAPTADRAAAPSTPGSIDPERRARVYGSIISASPAVESLIAMLDRAARIDAVVLLLGESGSGKDLFARAYHEASGRGSGPFVAVNCAAVPRELAEGLFFGHARGSFTGAQADRPGWFEEARGGTLFLDEIGELPPELQGALLRAVETRRIRRLGGQGERDIDARIVAATNRDLADDVRRGSFRSDLYFRLEEIPLRIPALRERRMDIPLLAERFLDEFAALSPLGRIRLSAAALEELAGLPWPGNVRELRNTIRRVAVSARAPLIESFADAPWFARARDSARAGSIGTAPAPEIPPAAPARAPAFTERDTALRDRILQALDASGGDIEGAAARLGISRATLYRRLSSLGIRPSARRP